MKHRQKNGFTLVELSIVLIIIGLLIGGILVGQSMITTTKIQTFIRQVQQADAAFSNFQVKYNGLPGDTVSMGCSGNSNHECGNKYIEDNTTGIGYSATYNGEAANFWVNLNQTGYDAAKTYTSTVTGTINSSPSAPNLPSSALGDNASMAVYSHQFDSIVNWYMVGDYSRVTNADRSLFTNCCFSQTYTNPNAIKSVDAKAVDLKIDDGVLSMDSTKNVHARWFGTGTAHDCVLTDDKCVLFVRMLSQVGQVTRPN